MPLDQEIISKPQLELTIDGIITTVVKGERKIIPQDICVIRNRIKIENAPDAGGGQWARGGRIGSLPTHVEPEA